MPGRWVAGNHSGRSWFCPIPVTRTLGKRGRSECQTRPAGTAKLIRDTPWPAQPHLNPCPTPQNRSRSAMWPSSRLAQRQRGGHWARSPPRGAPLARAAPVGSRTSSHQPRAVSASHGTVRAGRPRGWIDGYDLETIVMATVHRRPQGSPRRGDRPLVGQSGLRPVARHVPSPANRAPYLRPTDRSVTSDRLSLTYSVAGGSADHRGGESRARSSGEWRQWLKWRRPVKTMAMWCRSATSIAISSRIEPPGWMIAVTPAWAAAAIPSGNGK